MRSLWLVPPFLIGTFLRLWNLHNQILGDDELHLVRTALTQPLGTILTTYQKVDTCIPLSALYRVLAEAGLRLTELNLRLPALLSGLALLVIAPLWADRRLGRGTAIAFAWLLAISPGLVLYSRIARPYMPVVLLSFGAAVAFDAWWRRGGWSRGAAYAFLAALAFWFHPVAAPLALAPLLFGALSVRDRRQAVSVAVLAAVTVFTVLAILAPPLPSFLEVLGAKHQELELAPKVWGALAKLQAGTARLVQTGLFWVVAVLGLWRLLREERELGAFTGCLVAGQLAGLLLASPLGLDAPLIFHRYALVVLPWVLLWVAAALGKSWAAAVMVITVLAATSPLADAKLWRSGFPHHDDYLAFYAPRPSAPLPYLYGKLGPGTLLEAPWIPVWRVSRAVYLYQEVHGREVVAAAPDPLLSDRRLALRNLVAATPTAFLASRARWLIVHRDFAAEEDAIPDRRWPPRMGVGRRFREVFQSQGRLLPRQLRRLWGKPDYADGRMAIWDLDRVRG
ncbi:MAG TPA: glycosyltransferase family 39 protein [Thermoanaerobaculia bacterium]|nr:glycosyltransferase family 39 protein [Thermoanaerobaculia bacterium]